MSSLQESEENDVVPQGLVIPVFCTADIPSQTLDLLLERDAVHRNESSYRLWIVTDDSEQALDTIGDQYSKPPFQAFPSAYLNMPTRQVNDIFWQKFRGRGDFASIVFFIMDAYAADDETLTVVEARDPADFTEDDPGIDTLRTDFYAARQVATLTDLCVDNLLQNRDYTKVYDVHQFPMDL